MRRKDTIMRKQRRVTIDFDKLADPGHRKSFEKKLALNDEISMAGVRQAQRKANERLAQNEKVIKEAHQIIGTYNHQV